MAEDMMERTAKAVYPLVNVDWDDARTISRVALLTALDPEDEALVEAVAEQIDKAEWSDEAEAAVVASETDRLAYNRFLVRAALVALKQKAQGEPVLSRPTLEED